MGFFVAPFFSGVGLLVLQLMLIIGLPRVLNYGLVHIGQPLVLSELIAGIIYGDLPLREESNTILQERIYNQLENN